MCECTPGFSGKHCEENICLPNPCQHGGTCQPVSGVIYKCICKPGFTGKNCEKDVRPCSTGNPCLNGGTCNPLTGIEYKCHCKEGFTGRNCENDERPCIKSNPCKNGGSCKNTGGLNYICECTPGFSGKHCEENVCLHRACLHGGTCQPVSAKIYECICKPGFSGKHCEVIKDPCQPNPCENGGLCVKSHSRSSSPSFRAALPPFRCNCLKGFKGPKCEAKCEKVAIPVDVIFLVDGSGSLYSQKETNCQPAKFRFELEFVLDVIDELEIGEKESRIGFIQFASSIDLVQRVKLSDSVSLGKARLKQHVDGVEWAALPQYNGLPPYQSCKPKLKPLGSQTNTPQGMKTALDMFETDARPSSKKMLFILTDGKIDPVSERSKALPTALELIGKDVDIFAVGIQASGLKEEDAQQMEEDLVNLTGGRKERVFRTDDFDKLKKQVLDSVLNAVNCQ